MDALALGAIVVIGLAVIAMVISVSAAAVRGSGRRATRSRNHSSAGIWSGGGDSGGWGGWGGGDGGSCGGGGDGGGGGGGC